jgi:hypothetical protein
MGFLHSGQVGVSVAPSGVPFCSQGTNRLLSLVFQL